MQPSTIYLEMCSVLVWGDARSESRTVAIRLELAIVLNAS